MKKIVRTCLNLPKTYRSNFKPKNPISSIRSIISSNGLKEASVLIMDTQFSTQIAKIRKNVQLEEAIVMVI